jgi:hypothetical protein
MTGNELTKRVAVELARHRKRYALNPADGWRCACGGWMGRTSGEWNQHLAESVVSTIGEDLGADLTRLLDRMPGDDTAQSARRAGFADAYYRVRDLLAGCTCHGGMVGHWGCPVEGHDPSWEE